MSRFYKVLKRASELRTGDRFIDWAIRDECFSGPPARILNIKTKRTDMLVITLDTEEELYLHPGHSVIVQELA